MTDQPCTHPDRPEPVADAPDWTCPACGALVVTVTLRLTPPAPETVYVDRPAPLLNIRCTDDLDGQHDPHPWTVAVGPHGDVTTVACHGQPITTTEIPEADE